jgi:anaerobic ribonucleoside-triphosphate reductase activating protein
VIRAARILERTRAEGPGLRFCLWVQGCTLRCPGCYAAALQDPAGGFDVDEAELIARVRALAPELEGITLLGGEPFLQAAPLARLAAAAREAGLSVLCFTGFVYEDLLSRADPDQLSLLRQVDLLLDGPYRQAERDFSRPLIGSRNQRYRFLTPRYDETALLAAGNRIEVRIGKDGVCRLNGMGDFPALEQQLKRSDYGKEEEHVILKF